MLTSAPVVQIHLSRFCNFRCLHCYSSSGPSERNSLPVPDLLHMTAKLIQAGYHRVSLSGGEPVLAPGFSELARGLAEQGFRVAVITNGSRLAPILEAMKEGMVHHTSVSFDGPQLLHDKVRAKSGSFDLAKSTLQSLADAGQSCGAVLSATRSSLPHLPDLVDLVCAAGASHVQLHPIASTGRAKRNIQDVGPELSSEALLRLVAMTRLFQRIYPAVHFQADVVLGQDLRTVSHDQDELISPLVITDDGALVPFCFDISRDFSLGQFYNYRGSFQLGVRLQQLLNTATDEVTEQPAASFYRELVALSEIPLPDGIGGNVCNSLCHNTRKRRANGLTIRN